MNIADPLLISEATARAAYGDNYKQNIPITATVVVEQPPRPPQLVS
jgi:hypothetical protein